MKRKIFFLFIVVLVIVLPLIFTLLGYHIAFAHPNYVSSMDLFPIIVYKDTDSCSIGNVCVYRIPKNIKEEYGFSTVTHRVVDFDGEFYTFKGDNNDFVEIVHKDYLIGKVLFN